MTPPPVRPVVLAPPPPPTPPKEEEHADTLARIEALRRRVVRLRQSMGVRGLLVLSCLGLLGCYEPPAWRQAPLTHECTVEQMARVQSEAAWCSEHTGYLGTYCYGASILRLCAPRDAGVQ